MKETDLMSYSASGNGLYVLRNLLGFSHVVDDAYLSVHPDVLQHYKKVILLHNEYVTKSEFDAIRAHSDVTYLYPNALLAEVDYNASSSTIKLVAGHGYKTPYAFDWPYAENTSSEHDTSCTHMEFKQVPNGRLLNCYPENVLSYRMDLWTMLKS